ncbi:MAG: O-antigen ligase family protein [Patescibacteria group bacterium]|nr:O-antigen ligase family protein [Patescibacteria group bacterium]
MSISLYGLLGLVAILCLIALSIFVILTINNPFWGFSLLVFFLPFERIPSIDIGLFTLKINQVLAFGVLIAWFLAIIIQRKKIRPNPLIWPIFGFLLVSFVSILFAGNLQRAIEVFGFELFMILVSTVTINLITTKFNLEKIISIIFWSGLVVCLFAIYQFFGDLVGLPQALTGLKEGYTSAVFGFPRVQAFSNEPLYLANFLFIPLGIAVAFYFLKTGLIKRSNLFWFIAFMVLIFILTISRGAYLGLAAMVIFYLILLPKRILSLRNIVTIASVILIAAIGVYIFLSKANPQAYDEFIKHVTVTDIQEGESVQGRLQSYAQAIKFWEESPVIGVGIGNYGPKVKDYPPADQVEGWDIVNNEYLEILAERGTLGIIFFSLIILVVFIRSIKAYLATKDIYLKATILGLNSAFVAILVQYNFFSTLYIMHFWVLIGLIIAAQNIALNSKIIENES